MFRRYSLVAACFAIAVGSGLAGCKTASLGTSSLPLWPSSAKDPDKNKKPIETPERMAVVWTDAVYNEPGQTPIRGFGGRIYFYNEQNRDIRVEGELTVYVYNDTQSGPSSRPMRKYVFRPEQFASHYSETQLGASYSVWIPWDPVGSPQVQLSLLPVFRGADGKVVMGHQALNILPGPKPEMIEYGNAPPPSSVRPVGYQASIPAPATPADDRQLRVTTIPAPSSLRQKMIMSGPQAAGTRGTPQSPPVAATNATSSLSGRTAVKKSTVAVQAAPETPTSTPDPTAPGNLPKPWHPPSPRESSFVRPRFPQRPAAFSRP